MQLSDMPTWLFVVLFVALLWLTGLGALGWGLWRRHTARRERFAAPWLRLRLLKWNIITPTEDGTTLTDELVRNWTRENANRSIDSGIGMLVASTLSSGVLYILRGTPIGTSQDVWAPLVGTVLIGNILGLVLTPSRGRPAGQILPQADIQLQRRPRLVLLTAVGVPALYSVITLFVMLGIVGSYPTALFLQESGHLDPRVYPWALWLVPITCFAVLLTSELAVRIVSHQASPRLSSDDGMARRAAQKLYSTRLAGLAAGEALTVPLLAMQQNTTLQLTHVGALGFVSIVLTYIAFGGILVTIVQILPIVDAPVQLLPGETA